MMSPDEEKEWALTGVYRRTSAGHWEKHEFGTSANRCQSVVYQSIPYVGAMPKRGCVTIRKMRMRIPLAKEARSSMSTDNGVQEVVRRGDCLLFSSKSRLRAMVLKFPSIRDCAEFSDHLLALNPSLPLPTTTTTRDSSRTSTSTSTSSNASEASLSATATKRCYDEAMACDQEGMDVDTTGQQEDATGESNTSNLIDPLVVQRNDIFSYMVRLLHDEDFRSFMNKIESCITSSPDGQLILAALQQQSATADMPSNSMSIPSEITE